MENFKTKAFSFVTKASLATAIIVSQTSVALADATSIVSSVEKLAKTIAAFIAGISIAVVFIMCMVDLFKMLGDEKDVGAGIKGIKRRVIVLAIILCFDTVFAFVVGSLPTSNFATQGNQINKTTVDTPKST